MARPVFLVVSDNHAVRDDLTADLRRRFHADYRVLPAESGLAALTTLAQLASRSEDVAIVLADETLVEPPAVDLLVRAHALHPAAKRVLLVNRGHWSAAHPAVAATAIGQVDYHVYIPWRPVEQILYPAIADFLADWDKDNEPPPGGLRVVGPMWSVRSHDLRDTLSRVGIPFWFYDEDSTAGRHLLDAAGIPGSGRPVIITFDGSVLLDPSQAELMTTLGMRTSPDADNYDVVILGAGPAGLAAAVYAASEGLHTMVLEPAVPGGQAGTSSMIRNYLGFHRGISGDELTTRALEQAWRFGAEFVLGNAATGFRQRGRARLVRTGDGREVAARSVVVATGVSWRRLGIAALEDLVGTGVFYGAAVAEGWAQEGRDVFVVGAGNSAGQAALYLARWAASVTILVRGSSLGGTMSEYLVKEVEKTPTISVRLRTEVVDGCGQGYLQTVTLRHRDSGATEVVGAHGLFLMIGAEPRTSWLGDSVRRCDRGFVLTGRDLGRAGELPEDWPLTRPPLQLETSVPGVFAAGDVRHRSIKRVAAAVGEGATAIQLVHEYLNEV